MNIEISSMEIPPVLVIIFNRPDFAYNLFQVLEKVKPPRLYIVSDGPRTPEEKIPVIKSREAFETINWNCIVKRDYSETNFGLRMRISGGISWAFESEDQLIILEDDCIPHPDFFKFCDSLLKKYKNDNRIMCVTGCNLNPKLTINNSDSYFFSKYAGSWGWATWKRAWELYDSNLEGFNDENVLKSFAFNLPYRNRSRQYWFYKLKKVKKGTIDSWAYRWIFSLWTQSGLAIVPKNNLINNIGIDDRSTNTRGKLSYINLETSAIDAEKFSHPKYVIADSKYDKWTENTIFSKSFSIRIMWALKKIFPFFK